VPASSDHLDGNADPAIDPTAPTDDRSVWSFTVDGPWNLVERPPAWMRRVPGLRVAVSRELPKITRAPRLPPVLRALTVVRHLGWAVAVWAVKERGSDMSKAGISRRMRVAAEALGPTYIKLAQIISAGEGVFPTELVTECKKCRDQVPAVGYDRVVETIEADLGVPIHEVFRSIEPTPIAAASVAQVHAAVLHTGESVVVKVQRPGIDELVHKDLRVLAWLAPFLVGRIPVSALANPPALVELFAETIIEELDFRIEAANILDVGRVFVELDKTDFVVPRPHPEYVTQRILVMERLVGFSFDDALGMQDAGIDTEQVVKTAMLGFLEGAFLQGVFHGDLHGGNMFVLDGGVIGLVDFGITGRLTEKEQLAFLRMMMTATMNDVPGQVAALRDLGTLPADTDVDAVIKDLGLDGVPLDPTKLEPDELIAELQRIIKALLGYGARMPKPLMLYVKNLIFIDGAIANLAPQLDMFKVVTDIATHFAVNHGASIAQQLGVAQEHWKLDLDGVKAGFGVDPNETDRLTYAELQERRKLINKRLTGKHLD